MAAGIAFVGYRGKKGETLLSTLIQSTYDITTSDKLPKRGLLQSAASSFSCAGAYCRLSQPLLASRVCIIAAFEEDWLRPALMRGGLSLREGFCRGAQHSVVNLRPI